MVRSRIGFSLSSIFLIWASLISKSFRRWRAGLDERLRVLVDHGADIRRALPRQRSARQPRRSSPSPALGPSHHVDEFLLGRPQLGAVDVGDRVALSSRKCR